MHESNCNEIKLGFNVYQYVQESWVSNIAFSTIQISQMLQYFIDLLNSSEFINIVHGSG